MDPPLPMLDALGRQVFEKCRGRVDYKQPCCLTMGVLVPFAMRVLHMQVHAGMGPRWAELALAKERQAIGA